MQNSIQTFLLLVLLNIGCNSRPSSSIPAAKEDLVSNTATPQDRADLISTGMEMAAATEILVARGLRSEQMAMSGNHSAYTLPDGRALVLMGDAAVDAILVIDNPDQPKAFRPTST